MGEYVSAYSGDEIDGLLKIVQDNQSSLDVAKNPLGVDKGGTGAKNPEDALKNMGVTATADELNTLEGMESNVQEQISKLWMDSTLGLTRHYKLHNGYKNEDGTKLIPWDSGTLVCDMNHDGSIFRLHGNTYKSSEYDAWWNMPWIPGTNEKYAGYKTFKVKPPADGQVKWIDCAGLRIHTTADSLSTGNMNYDNICIGTDGYIYIATMSEQPKTHAPLLTLYSGITCCVDSEVNDGYYVLGRGDDPIDEEIFESDWAEDGELVHGVDDLV